jgi:hypothetical protein
MGRAQFARALAVSSEKKFARKNRVLVCLLKEHRHWPLENQAPNWETRFCRHVFARVLHTAVTDPRTIEWEERIFELDGRRLCRWARPPGLAAAPASRHPAVHCCGGRRRGRAVRRPSMRAGWRGRQAAEHLRTEHAAAAVARNEGEGPIVRGCTHVRMHARAPVSGRGRDGRDVPPPSISNSVRFCRDFTLGRPSSATRTTRRMRAPVATRKADTARTPLLVVSRCQEWQHLRTPPLHAMWAAPVSTRHQRWSQRPHARPAFHGADAAAAGTQ